MPDDLLKLARVPAALLLIVTKLPNTPDKVKSANVCAELAVKVIVLGLVVAVKSLNELLPEMVNAPAPPWFSVEYEPPPPANVFAVAAVILIIMPVIVIPVADALENAVAPAPVIVYVPDPVMDLVSVPVLANVALVTGYVEPASVPCVSVRAPLKVSELARVAVPVVLTISVGSVLPLLVMVPVPTMVGVRLVNVPPVDNVSPFKFNVVTGTTNAVVPKSKMLNQLAVVNVCIAVPLAVNHKFGDMVADPPVVPNT